MLILSRKSDESVVVGGSGSLEQTLKVTVIEIGSKHVRLGFEANEKVPIHRSEVWERLQALGPPTTQRPQAELGACRESPPKSDA